MSNTSGSTGNTNINNFQPGAIANNMNGINAVNPMNGMVNNMNFAAGNGNLGMQNSIQSNLNPNANLKNMALQMALKETDPDEVKDSEMVYGEFGTGENKVTGYGFATTMKSGERSYEIGGQKFNAFKGLAEPEENKPEKYFKADLVKVRKVGDTQVH